MGNVRKISKRYYLRQIVACMLVYFMFFGIPAQIALADIGTGGWDVVQGDADITANGGGEDAFIDLISTRAVINWQDFDTDIGQLVEFVRTSGGNFAVLNRIIGEGGATQFNGNLQALMGDVFIVNTRGIIFGPESFVQARTIVLSAIDIADRDFMVPDGQFQFEKNSSGHPFDYMIGDVTNEGIGTDHGIHAKEVALIGRNVTNKGSIVASGRDNIVLMAAGESVMLSRDGSNVAVEVTMAEPAEHIVDNGGDLGTGAGTITANNGKVILAAGDIYSAAIEGVETLRAEAKGDITLEGAISTTTGDIKLAAGDDVDAQVLDAGGNVDISASDTTINLHDDVTAGVDIVLNNNTVADADIALTAGQNVDIAADKTVTALGSLGIEATGGEIMADTSIIDMAADGKTLSLKQNANMDLEQDFSVNNRTNTYLVADSTGGSVTSDAAGEWKSITAHAADNITLSDISEVITTGALNTDNGDIKVTAESGKVYAEGAISAGRDVVITATDESSDSIFLSDGAHNIDAVRDIWLNNNTYTDGPTKLTAGQDIRLGYNENLDTYDAKTLTAEESLTLEANRHITLGGDVTVIGSEPETLIVKADADTVDGGDVHAMGKLTTIGGYENDILVYGDNIRVDGTVSSAADIEISALEDVTLNSDVLADGDIDIYSSDDTTYLGGDLIEASGNVTLHNNTVLNGGDQRIDAETGTLTAMKDVDKSTAGSMALGGDTGITLGGNVTGTGMTDADTMTLEDNVTANGAGNQRIDGGAGTLAANGSITKTNTGDLNLGGDEAIDLDGTVDVQTTSGSLTIEDDFTAAADLIASENVTLEGDATLDGSVNQKIQAENGDLKINPSVGPTGVGLTEPYIHKTGTGNLEMLAGRDISLYGHVTVDEGKLDIAAGGTAGLYGNLKSSDDMTLSSRNGSYPNAYLRLHGNAESTNGSVEMTGNGAGIYMYWEPWGIDVTAGEDILINDSTTITYSGAKLDAGRDVITASGKSLSGHGALTVEADRHITLGGLVEAGTSFAGDLILAADADDDKIGNMTANGNVINGNGNITISGVDVTVYGDVESDGILDVDADDDIMLKANVSSVGEMMMDAGSDIELNRSSGNTSSESTITLNAGDSISIGRPFSGEGNVTANGNMDLIAGTDSGDDVKVLGKLTTTNGGNVNVKAGGDIRLYGTFNGPAFESAEADGDLTLDAEDDIDVLGDLISNNGSVELSSDNTTTYLGGDVTAAVDVTLNNNTVFDDDDDQKVDAQSGMITANGWLWKDSDWGSLYLEAAGDISLADDVVANWGGVSIISENGKIFTPDECGYETDTLSIYIEGYSDQLEGDGVSLPGDPEKKAAIVIISEEDLKLGPYSQLIANGYYLPLHAIDIDGIDSFEELNNYWDELYNEFGSVIDDLYYGFEDYLYDLEVDPEDFTTYKELLGDYLAGLDDRPAIGFLAEPDVAIGGIIRDEGKPIDVAVYLQSETGDVDVESGLISVNYNGTMVVDAYDTVTFGDLTSEPVIQTVESVEVREGRFWEIDRLEVASRITEWLFEADAFGTLPYPYNPEIVESFIGGEYVLRGAGLGNPAIVDGRAWVLEDPLDPAPLYEEAGEAAEEEEFAEGGCPPLMDWLANEIGIPAEDIQVSLAGALALNTDVQPCEMCARLMDAAATMEDAEGMRIAAMARVVNEFVTTPAPPSPEQMTQIAAALSEHVGDGTYYALAGEWIDALAAYVGIMNTEMGYSASDAAAFAQKYLAPVEDTGNAALIAYVQARLAALGG